MKEDMEQMTRRGEQKCKWKTEKVKKGRKITQNFRHLKDPKGKRSASRDRAVNSSSNSKRGMCGQSNTKEKLVNKAQPGLCKPRDKVRYNSQSLLGYPRPMIQAMTQPKKYATPSTQTLQRQLLLLLVLLLLTMNMGAFDLSSAFLSLCMEANTKQKQGKKCNRITIPIN